MAVSGAAAGGWLCNLTLMVHSLFGKDRGCSQACLDNHSISISPFIYQAAVGGGRAHRCVMEQIFNRLVCQGLCQVVERGV